MLEYVIKGKYAEIVGATDDETIIEIPKKIDDYIVVKIQENAFIEHPSLISITIPKTVKVIGSYAFASCKKLKKVIIEEGLQYINDWAFISCNIDSIELPESLIYLGDNAFVGSKCYNKIKAWKDERKVLTQVNNKSKYDMCIFPTKAIKKNTNISKNFVEQFKSYQDLQMSNYKENVDALYSLDLPYIFDNHEFIVAVNSNEKLEDISIYIPSSTYMNVGNYADNDPDFILFELEIYSTNVLLGSVFFKIPYPDDVTLKIVNISYNNGVNIIKILPSIASFGSGNIDREFAVNYYDEVLAKFKTAYNNRIITFDEYEVIEKKLTIMGKNKALQFVRSIENAPLLSLILKLFKLVSQDSDYSDKLAEINDYLDDEINYYYNEIKDIDSLHKVAFNVSSQFKFLNYITELDSDKLCEKYGLKLIDNKGIEISEQRLNELSDLFFESEELYNIHGYLYDDILFEIANFIEEYYDNKLIDYIEHFNK